jgi:hypothetical protein
VFLEEKENHFKRTLIWGEVVMEVRINADDGGSNTLCVSGSLDKRGIISEVCSVWKGEGPEKFLFSDGTTEPMTLCQAVKRLTRESIIKGLHIHKKKN